MAARKRSAKPVPVVADEPTGLYVRLPLAPEVIAAVREHADNARALLELVERADATAGELAEACVRALGAVRRDVAKVRGRRRRRRRR